MQSDSRIRDLNCPEGFCSPNREKNGLMAFGPQAGKSRAEILYFS